jgi:hypothetical protein
MGRQSEFAKSGRAENKRSECREDFQLRVTIEFYGVGIGGRSVRANYSSDFPETETQKCPDYLSEVGILIQPTRRQEPKKER